MIDYSIQAVSVKKIFGRRLIFDNLSFGYSGKGVYGIAGSNGSGKSTLVKILAGIIAPSSGKVTHLLGEKEIIPEKLHNYIGFVSPYLVLYDEFNAIENLKFTSGIRGIEFNSSRADELLDLFNIYSRRNDPVKAYSSGMKQRLKFVFALLHSPALLILDEPTSNLDSSGKDIVYNMAAGESSNRIILIASNEENDLRLCSSVIELENYKNIREGERR
jgi:heme exporter protein A